MLSDDKEPAGASSLEEYASSLETTLTLKSALLDETNRLHQSLEARVLALEESLSVKDAQLEAQSRQSSEAWARATEEFALVCRDRDAWRERAGSLEIDVCVLHDAALEHIEECERLRKQIAEAEHEMDLSSQAMMLQEDEEPQTAIKQMTKQLEELRRKNALLDETLKLRQIVDPVTQTLKETETQPDVGALPFTEAWARIGLGAADRLCGASPHVEGPALPANGCLCSPNWGGEVGRINIATGGKLPQPPADEPTASPICEHDPCSIEACAALHEGMVGMEKTPPAECIDVA